MFPSCYSLSGNRSPNLKGTVPSCLTWKHQEAIIPSYSLLTMRRNAFFGSIVEDNFILRHSLNVSPYIIIGLFSPFIMYSKIFLFPYSCNTTWHFALSQRQRRNIIIFNIIHWGFTMNVLGWAKINKDKVIWNRHFSLTLNLNLGIYLVVY